MTTTVEAPAAPSRLEVREPGVYELDHATYHADPVPGGSLSSSGARLLLPPSCPARYRWEADHPSPPSDAMERGTAAHTVLLGTGPAVVEVDADSWRTKAAKQAREDITAAGGVALLPDDYAHVHAMAAALAVHPLARHLFNPDHGDPERSLFWVDGPSGVWRRARLDWLPHPQPGRRPLVVDYKTTATASPAALARTITSYGYHLQAAWYLDAGAALGLWDESAVFLFVFQERTPPYLVTVAEVSAIDMRTGRQANRRAIDTYRACTESGRWPGYSDDEPAAITLPPWAAKQALEDL